MKTPRLKVFEKNMFNHGRRIGEASVQLVVTNSKFLRQIMIGIQTEHGIARTAHVYYQEGTVNTEVKTLYKCREGL
jgi:hypothetical protein